jgi:hypothetical protein
LFIVYILLFSKVPPPPPHQQSFFYSLSLARVIPFRAFSHVNFFLLNFISTRSVLLHILTCIHALYYTTLLHSAGHNSRGCNQENLHCKKSLAILHCTRKGFLKKTDFRFELTWKLLIIANENLRHNAKCLTANAKVATVLWQEF